MYEQLDLFGFAPSQYIIKKPIRLIELFAGIGAQSKALEVLKANFESYKIAEWSKESIKAYTYIHHYSGIDYEKVIKEYVKGEILNEIYCER